MNLSKSDYVQLWCHFESRAETLKQGMFSTSSWLLGFAASLLVYLSKGAIFQQQKASTLKYWYIAGSIIGILICIASILIARHAKNHIWKNWNKSKTCKKKLESGGEFPILETDPKDENRFLKRVDRDQRKVQTWHIVYIVSSVIGLSFVVVFLFACNLN